MYALNDVWIRPPFGGKGRKMTGQLEAHANGFRYSSPKGEQLDIMYRCTPGQLGHMHAIYSSTEVLKSTSVDTATHPQQVSRMTVLQHPSISKACLLPHRISVCIDAQ